MSTISYVFELTVPSAGRSVYSDRPKYAGDRTHQPTLEDVFNLLFREDGCTHVEDPGGSVHMWTNKRTFSSLIVEV